jgi:iron complex transport system substrate-binding protein
MLVLLGALSGAPAAADPAAPQRVVSMNLCTDQLAMLLAAPGQLLSVSYLASDPHGSAMAEAAKVYPPNRGLAEEVYLMQPDLVLAGSFTTRATVAMLQRLGVRVEIFEPAYGLDDIPDRIRQMGMVLGRTQAAEAIVAQFEADLRAFREDVSRNPRAAIYAANGYTQGDRSLSGQILLTAGFANVAAEAGYDGGGILPLELLVMLTPEAIITSRPYPGASRAEEVMVHPALLAAQDARVRGSFADRDWVCGTPFALRAVAKMAALRRSLTEDATEDDAP